MWLCTRYGFFSAVCARLGKGRAYDPVDPNRIMVRARMRKHLENLQRHFDQLDGLEILESPSADYRYRLFVEKNAWAEVVHALVLETDYDNFKHVVASEFGAGDPYEHALHRVWGIFHHLQP